MAQESDELMEFGRLVIDALESAGITYLIGGAVAVWAWGEPRTTRDFDLVIHLPVERIVSLSQALEQRRMLTPPDILLDLLLQPEGDLPVNAIHLGSGYKAEQFLLREAVQRLKRLQQFGSQAGASSGPQVDGRRMWWLCPGKISPQHADLDTIQNRHGDMNHFCCTVTTVTL